MRAQESERKKLAVARKCSGFSLLELVVVIIMMSILITMAISKLLDLRVDAERVAMQTVVGTLQSALGMKVAEAIVNGRLRELGELETTNPMDRLSQLPPNYLGELSGDDPNMLDNGNWYFDTQDRVLVYLVRNKGFFEGGLSDPPRVRFAVRLVYTDRNSNGRYDAAVDAIEGVRLVALESYRWKK